MEQWENFGNVSMVSAISDFTISAHGAAVDIEAQQLRNGLGMLQVDQWADGRSEQRAVNGVKVMVRRDGWRIQVWGAEEETPAVDELPPPADLATRPRVSTRVKIAPGYIEPDASPPAGVYAPPVAAPVPDGPSRPYYPTPHLVDDALRAHARAMVDPTDPTDPTDPFMADVLRDVQERRRARALLEEALSDAAVDLMHAGEAWRELKHAAGTYLRAMRRLLPWPFNRSPVPPPAPAP